MVEYLEETLAEMLGLPGGIWASEDCVLLWDEVSDTGTVPIEERVVDAPRDERAPSEVRPESRRESEG